MSADAPQPPRVLHCAHCGAEIQVIDEAEEADHMAEARRIFGANALLRRVCQACAELAASHTINVKAWRSRQRHTFN